LSAKTIAILAVAVIGVRAAHMGFPSLLMASALWLVAAALVFYWAQLLRQKAIPTHGAMLVGTGAILNGLVIMVNGGVMPVIGMEAGTDGGAWRSAEHGGHLLFLADRMALAGASPGDLMILAGMLMTLAVPLLRWARNYL
jgi:hypothetical protein